MATRTNISVPDFIKAVFEAKTAEDNDKLFLVVDTENPAMDEEGLPIVDENDEPVFETEEVACTAIEFIAANTGLNEKTVEQKLTTYRNPEFKYEEYELDGKPVYLSGIREEYETSSGEIKERYKRNDDNTAATTTNVDDARTTKDGELVRAQRKVIGEDGNPVILRAALPIPTFKRGGGGRTGLADQVDEAMLLISQLTGKSIEELQAEAEKANAKAVKRATAE